MKPWHTFLLALAAAVVLADLFAVSECSPGHMNIPYYQKRKEEAQHREMAELARECRNSRNMDPKCAQAYARTAGGASTTSSSSCATAVLLSSALLLGRVLGGCSR